MQINEIKNVLLDEKYFEIQHDSGLKILVMPKEGYATSYAVFGTKYGSIDNCFRKKGEQAFTTVPEGIAHFLEHKLFENKDLDAFERYAKTGASANAYTSFDRTCYLFSCTGDFKSSLEILLDFVQSPYFTKETVEKEQGIIGQEITMYKDVPDWQVLFNCLRAMYEYHPVRIDIAGTVESIAQITDELLYKCYHTFYNLNNMVLAVTGNVTIDDVLEIANKYLKKAAPQEIERQFIPEKKEVLQPYIEEKLSVVTPIFTLGFKETWETPERTLKEEICAKIILSALAGNTSELYKRLMDDKLINTTFCTEYFTGYGYQAMLFSGESSDPHAVVQQIKAEINKFKQNGIGKEIFERTRKKLYGSTIMSYNDVEELANNLVESAFMDETLFDDLDIYKSLTENDINEMLSKVLDEKYAALSVILPA